MFQFLFKYPVAAFSKGNFVLLSAWPTWLLLLAIIGVAGLLAWSTWRRGKQVVKSLRGRRVAILWLLQSATVAVLLLLLWEPAISVTALRAQQNIIAIVLDDSRSMASTDTGLAREQQAIRLLKSDLLPDLQRRFQVRFYRLTSGVKRISDLDQLHADGSATRIGDGLKQLADEAATLPIGAVVLMSDGSDNSGGIDNSALTELHRRRLPVNTIGFGKETLVHDVEIENVTLPSKAIVNSRIASRVTIRQNGFTGRQATVVVRGDAKVLTARQITLTDAPEQVEDVEFAVGHPGVKDIEVKVDPLPGEQNLDDNRVTRVLSVDGSKHRILYVEGEPRWEFKFLRRAVEDDPALEIVSMLRTTQNKIYRQGIANPNELADGFPIKAEDLFEYQGLILGSVESAFFSTAQQAAIKDFVDRRGGGLLFLGGRASLADGGYNVYPFSELLPVSLPPKRNTFQRRLAAAQLTPEGAKSLVCRIEDDPEKSANHWEVLPYLADYQNPGTPKPGAVVLARVEAGGERIPLLITENYGRGRTAVFATGGSWRWKMQQPVADSSQQTFWRQLLRWSAGSTPSRVVSSTPVPQINDDGRVQLRAEVRDKSYLPTASADVQATVVGPNGASETFALHPEPLTQGTFTANWNANRSGSYAAEVVARRGNVELGRDVITFRREDGTAENFHREQNRDLLQKLADDTGGHYYTSRDAKRLTDEISFSEAGITGRETKDLWNMPAIFFAILLLRGAEWLLRRKWGVV